MRTDTVHRCVNFGGAAGRDGSRPHDYAQMIEMQKQIPATLEELNALIAASKPMVPGATRAVLGEGPVGAQIALVGEQPGDYEDRQGKPFVGPAGKLLDHAMSDAGIDRRTVYVTNAVRHFKFQERGKRRIHQKPTTGEVTHYRWWLTTELRLVAPSIVVALGATAVLALTGKRCSITSCRGPAEFSEWRGFITVHPSYLLRIPDKEQKRRAFSDFVNDFRQIHELAEKYSGIAAA